MLLQNALCAVLAHGVSTALAHVIMIEPHPFNLDTAPLLQTWPLSAALPFPCQGRYQHAEQVTTVTAGKTQTVKFWGSAVHGGGSCQFSMAYGDTPPENPDEWHTIYSILGGCPADAVGNIETLRKDPHQREDGPQCGNDADKECVREFQIPIPKDMKNGPATFAWTWFNKIGDREMYMVCAPIIVTGGVEDSTFVDSLPPIFRANIPGECTTGPSGNVIGFPDPGEFGKVYQQPDANSEGTCPAANIPDFDRPAGGDAPISSEPSQPSSPSSEAPVSSEPPVLPTSPVPPYLNSTVETSTVVQTAQPSGCVPTATVPRNSTPTETLESSERAPWPGHWVPCIGDGNVVCLEPGFFGVCNQNWAVPQPLAAGTKCENGKVV